MARVDYILMYGKASSSVKERGYSRPLKIAFGSVKYDGLGGNQLVVCVKDCKMEKKKLKLERVKIYTTPWFWGMRSSSQRS